ncbi:hypothetical protein FQN57_001705 [Myotisia sp. PD_48]|nr:hypothetical protein FQN57_001705 [Myotisia sp. PD_48]
MDRVPETPVRKSNGTQDLLHLHLSSYTDVDDIEEEHETVATVPVTRLPQAILDLTQPTQIIDRAVQPGSSQLQSVVQVFGSSPPRPTPSATQKFHSSIAPIGTQYRPPRSVIHAPVKRTPVVNIEDDDGPTYCGGSSDDADTHFGVPDIKPSLFMKSSRSPGKENVGYSPPAIADPSAKFKEITASAFYNPTQPAESKKRTIQNTGLEFSEISEQAQKRSRASSSHDKSTLLLSDIDDHQTKHKVQRMCSIFPDKSVQYCLDALVKCRGNFQDTMDHIVALDERDFVAQTSEDELSLAVDHPRILAAKQQIKSKSRIQDKWTSTQQQKTEPDSRPEPPVNRRRLIRGPRSKESSVNTTTAVEKASKPPSRLVRGRKPRITPELVIDEESSSELDVTIIPEDTQLETKVLHFFNSCTPDDLADIAGITLDLAAKLISNRPFPTLARVRRVTLDQGEVSKKSNSTTRKSSKKLFGDKTVDKCLDMWTGYEAVDALVAECEGLGKPIAEEMQGWDVDMFGSRKDGVVDPVTSGKGIADEFHDSGISSTQSSRQPSSEDAEDIQKMAPKRRFIPQPAVMDESITMKDYQVVGINWLRLLYRQGLSGILADDMGLGKTCQVIAFLAHLLERGVSGPHLVVVPASTLENWLREFSRFCPALKTMPYYAGQADRALIRQDIEDNRDSINVVITTYTIAKAKIDAAFLRSMDFNVCVYDEGHMLKSSKSQLYEKLIGIPARFRLLLTGTPLQNNLQELISLLGFILPSVFKARKEDLQYIFNTKATTVDTSHSTLLSAQRIARAKSMLAPFVLRRKKHQVIALPQKISRVEYCEMNEQQKSIYQNEKESVKQMILDRAAGKRGTKNSNILMKLRQAAIHPLFYRRLYDDKTLSRISRACLKDEKWAQSDPDQIYAELSVYNDFECHTLCTDNPSSLGNFALSNDEWMMSGKVDKLRELLERYIANGDRILIFSQFTMAMDMLEQVLETLHIKFFRLDGTTNVEDRQAILDAFYEQVDIPVFMLSTKAGGAGINLACANKVIIFDVSFNPQEDVQAENRAHRVGQTREVEVVRLITRGTIEEKIYALGQAKLALDHRVAGEDEPSAANLDENPKDKDLEELVISAIESEE